MIKKSSTREKSIVIETSIGTNNYFIKEEAFFIEISMQILSWQFERGAKRFFQSFDCYYDNCNKKKDNLENYRKRLIWKTIILLNSKVSVNSRKQRYKREEKLFFRNSKLRKKISKKKKSKVNCYVSLGKRIPNSDIVKPPLH